MSLQPSVSVITPSFNQAAFVERTICSVLEQGDLEYVVVDGGSTDGTLDILRRFGAGLRWISEPDHGQADAVNKGFSMTAGEIIGWLNSDDVYRPGAIETVRAFFGSHPEVDVLYGEADLVDPGDRVIGRYYTEPWPGSVATESFLSRFTPAFDAEPDVDTRVARRKAFVSENRSAARHAAERLARRPFLCQPAVFFRRRVLDRFGSLDVRLHYTLDYEFWLRLAFGGACFAYLPVTLAAARLHAETKTMRPLELYAELHPMLHRYLPRTPDSWLLSHTQALIDAAPPASTPLRYALAVALLSLELSLRINRSISPALAVSTARTLAAGAAKTLLGRSVQDVLRQRDGG